MTTVKVEPKKTSIRDIPSGSYVDPEKINALLKENKVIRFVSRAGEETRTAVHGTGTKRIFYLGGEDVAVYNANEKTLAFYRDCQEIQFYMG